MNDVAIAGIAQHQALGENLDEAAGLMEQAWPSDYAPARSIRVLSERLRAARLQLAVLGQFKRGKSTFINALLGARILPAGVVPLTAAPTFIAWAPVPCVRVTYRHEGTTEQINLADTRDLHDILSRFVTEQANPADRRDVSRVDVLLPADILRRGLVLIDTPGIGSTLRHNTETALQVLPECDAALFVISADPPITAAEIAYLARVRRHVARLFFVLNKIDYLTVSEQSEITDFVGRALRHAPEDGGKPTVYPVSAKRALEAAEHQDADASDQSGMGRIRRQIIGHLESVKRQTLTQSVRGKGSRLIEEAIGDLNLMIRALEMPVEDLERSVTKFREALAGIGLERQVAQDMVAGDRNRAAGALEIEASRLRRACRERLAEVADKAIRNNGGEVDGSVYDDIGAAVPLFFEQHRQQMTEHMRRVIEQALGAHQTRADTLVNTIRHTAADLLGIAFRAAEPPEPYRSGPDPYWVTRPAQDTLIPSPDTLLVRLLPRRARQARQRHRLHADIATLARRNVENLRWALLRGLDETFRRFQASFDERLADTRVVTEMAIASALEQRRTEADKASSALERWRHLRDRLGALHAAVVEADA